MVAATADATSKSQDDDSQEILANVNRLYLAIVGGEKKRRVYSLGSHVSTLYPDSFSSSATSCRTVAVTNHVADDRIRVLEEEIMRMREDQERIIQQRVEEEILHLKQQSDEQFHSLQEEMKSMTRQMVSSSGPSSDSIDLIIKAHQICNMILFIYIC
ncbi:hypothetical protein P3X46_012504 [Hevea brasiliensis]|uniref:Uncharacterized protein n=1 Tax=Hevea brasiliensis TaxID=3981 RepID=A0ABQ9MCB9_HEVBR|nr:hypothetical protein P3X46_012504 [Hevea brasiliensis]